MKTAVVYYSMSGNTAFVAGQIASSIGADLIEIKPEKAYPDSGAKKFIFGGKSAVMGDTPKLQPYVFDAAQYDCIVFGTPIWAGTFTPPIRSFLAENKPSLLQKRVAVFTCSAGGPGDKAAEKLRQFLGIAALSAHLHLVDAKNGSNDNSAAQIASFCSALQNEG